ncbi:hypothetical protein M2375_003420 [Comamonas sp. BIGb0152]|nr:hypothetical protein [Comamonas sp. BIGb0152]
MPLVRHAPSFPLAVEVKAVEVVVSVAGVAVSVVEVAV